MDINTSWDTEKYRTKFEAEEHWALKKEFIEAHKDRIPEERLICLAQVFVNIELLRCKYPDEVMKQVAVLAKEIGHDYKAKQKHRLQRTFVGASDAASAKVKGIKRKYTETLESSSSDIPLTTSSQVRIKYFKTLKSEFHTDSTVVRPNTSVSPRMRSLHIKPNQLSSDVTATQSNTKFWKEDNPNDPLKNILLIRYLYANFPGCYEVLKTSIQFSGFQLAESFESRCQQIICFLHAVQNKKKINLILGSGESDKKKEAKEMAAENAIKMLLTKCFTIKVLKRSSGNNEISLISTGDGPEGQEPDKLDDNNAGAKLMKLMGWSGGALGKSGQGITEPVNSSSVVGRQGLGVKDESNVSAKFKEKVKQLLIKFNNTEGMSDLVFAPDLSSEQRKHIHLTAVRIGRKKLKTTSYGKGNKRFLVVSHKLDSFHLMHKILAEGGMTDKYKLCEPGTITLEELSENLIL